MKKVLALVVIIGFVSCSNPIQEAKDKRLDDSIEILAKKMTDSIMREARKPVADSTGSKWQVSDEVDKMSGKTNHILSVQANDELDLKFPYSGGVTVDLTVRKKRGETNVYIYLSKGQFNSKVDGETISVRFDDNKAEKYYCSEASDGSSNILFITNAGRFISQLKKAKKTLIEAEFYDKGNKIMEFDTDKFEWK